MLSETAIFKEGRCWTAGIYLLNCRDSKTTLFVQLRLLQVYSLLMRRRTILRKLRESYESPKLSYQGGNGIQMITTEVDSLFIYAAMTQ
jgi:hypothetical protein